MLQSIASNQSTRNTLSYVHLSINVSSITRKNICYHHGDISMLSPILNKCGKPSLVRDDLLTKHKGSGHYNKVIRSCNFKEDGYFYREQGLES